MRRNAQITNGFNRCKFQLVVKKLIGTAAFQEDVFRYRLISTYFERCEATLLDFITVYHSMPVTENCTEVYSKIGNN